jgi:hypothetical protein
MVVENDANSLNFSTREKVEPFPNLPYGKKYEADA